MGSVCYDKGGCCSLAKRGCTRSSIPNEVGVSLVEVLELDNWLGGDYTCGNVVLGATGSFRWLSIGDGRESGKSLSSNNRRSSHSSIL